MAKKKKAVKKVTRKTTRKYVKKAKYWSLTPKKRGEIRARG